jgi:hypothetical protein
MVVRPPPIRVVWVNPIHRDGSRIGQELLDGAAGIEAEAQAVVALLLRDVNRTAEIIELVVQLAGRNLRRGAVPPTKTKFYLRKTFYPIAPSDCLARRLVHL